MNNTSTTTMLHGKYKDMILIIELMQATVITCANTLLVVIYLMFRPLQRKNGNYLLLCQALADLYIGALLWFEIVAFNWASNKHRHILHVVYTGMLEYSFVVCMGTLLVSALERYVSITRSVYHKQNITVNRLQRVTMLLWVVALIPVMCLLGVMQFDMKQANSSSVKRYSYLFDAFVLLIITVIASVLWKSLRHANSINKNNSFQRDTEDYMDLSNAKSKVLIKDTRLVKLFIATMAIFILTYIPIFIGRLIYDTGGLDNLSYIEHVVLVNTCHVLYKFSAICNPVMSLLVKKDYRDKIRSCLLRKREIHVGEDILMADVHVGEDILMADVQTFEPT